MVGAAVSLLWACQVAHDDNVTFTTGGDANRWEDKVLQNAEKGEFGHPSICWVICAGKVF